MRVFGLFGCGLFLRMRMGAVVPLSTVGTASCLAFPRIAPVLASPAAGLWALYIPSEQPAILLSSPLRVSFQFYPSATACALIVPQQTFSIAIS